jgi:uncharacterized protein (DUF849 family)
VSFSTSAGIEPDPARRLALVARWTVLPELVTANQGEPGIAELCAHLVARGVGIEAGVLSLADAELFVRSGLAKSCVRVLIEPLDADPQQAVAHAAAIEERLLGAGITLEQVHHGDGSPVGRSMNGGSVGDTASGRVSRTRPSSPTDIQLLTTPRSSALPSRW